MKNSFNFKIPKNKTESKYIGFDFEKDNSSFIFPCQYLDENDSEITKKQEAKKIINLLKRIQKDYLFNGNNNELFQFHSMIWIIQDFIDNGYYEETETISKEMNNGKINWKKTIKNNSILFNNGTIIYKDFIRDRNVTNSSQILTQIYKACLSYSVQRLGFVFGITETESSIFNIENKDKDYLIHTLNNELNNTYKDYKKVLINHMIAIITSQNSNNKTSGFSIYDSEFEYVFEFVINKVFGTGNVKDIYNTYSYHLLNDNKNYPASRLRPDTIIKDDINKTYYIVDSKYYNFGYTNKVKDLPQSSSIAKQIGYSHYLKEKLISNGINDYKVKSIFVLPYSSRIQNEYIKYIGFAKQDSNSSEEDNVAVCLIDLKELINTYLTSTKKINTSLLLKSIPK